MPRQGAFGRCSAWLSSVSLYCFPPLHADIAHVAPVCAKMETMCSLHINILRHMLSHEGIMINCIGF